MKANLRSLWDWWWGAPILSPLGFVRWAVWIWIGFGLVHALGLRPYVTILSGSVPSGGSMGGIAAMLGLAYTLAYFAAVLASPVLVLGAGFLAAMDGIRRLVGRRG